MRRAGLRSATTSTRVKRPALERKIRRGALFGNKNNHSVVTRVDFGSASLSSQAILQEEGIARLPAHYAGAGGVLDPDVYQVGHHGSHNATTVAPLNAITPLMAVIPAGNWDFGKAATTNFHTHAYGHPRKDTPDSLSNAIGGNRAEPLTIMAATGQRTFVPYGVGKHPRYDLGRRGDD